MNKSDPNGHSIDPQEQTGGRALAYGEAGEGGDPSDQQQDMASAASKLSIDDPEEQGQKTKEKDFAQKGGSGGRIPSVTSLRSGPKKSHPSNEAPPNQPRGGDTSASKVPPSGLGPTGTANARANANSLLTREQRKAIRSHQKQIDEHKAKIDQFKTNPTVRPGMAHLPTTVIKAQQQSRIRHLENEIRTFQKNIDKIRNGL